MSRTAGTYRGDEYWMRCPECGDSMRHKQKAHLSINLTSGLFHCFRCGFRGKLSPAKLMQFSTKLGVSMTSPSSQSLSSQSLSSSLDPIPGPGHPRRSRLDRYHIERDGVKWDVFTMRDPRDCYQCGWYLRGPNKQSRIIGSSGLGWWDRDFPDGVPVSSANNPITIVEGPYDVLNYRDVCTFGFITLSALQMLSGQFLWLVPDGDVWIHPHLFKRFVRTIFTLLSSSSWKFPHLLGVIHIPGSYDPDEVLLKNIPTERITRDMLPSYLRSYSRTYIRKE